METLITKILRLFQTTPKWVILAINVLLIPAIMAADLMTPPIASTTIHFLFVIPIWISVWFFGIWAGVVTVAIIETDTVIDQFNKFQGTSHMGVAHWNIFMYLFLYSGFAVIFSYLKTLLNNLRKGQEEARLLANRIIAAQEEERERLARELHDESSQQLTALTLGLEQIKLSIPEQLLDQSQSLVSTADSMKRLTETVLRDLRRIALNLRPKLLDELGLNKALYYLFEEQMEEHGIQVEFVSDAVDACFGQQVELALFRVAQEAITNIIRHSKANKVTVRLNCSQEQVDLEISDNGIGCEPKILQQRKENGSPHLGIIGMKERISLVGGKFSIKSIPEKGTTISVSVPLNEQFKLPG